MGINVLLVEDDEDLRDSVAEWLELAGMHVSAACNAAEFYQALPTYDFQVAVIDVGLPDQSGHVLAQYLRANTEVAVIMLTARSSVDDKIQGYDSGADLYLVKPVDCRELSAAIASIVKRVRRPEAVEPVIQQAVIQQAVIQQAVIQQAVMQQAVTQKDWTILAAQWKLRTASDVQISLSVKELKFLELLAATPGHPVLRKTVLESLYQRHDYHTGRSLDSMVRRLRAKVMSQIGAAIPIRTVHSVGYSFAGVITVC